MKTILLALILTVLSPSAAQQKAEELYGESKYQQAAELLNDILPQVRETSDKELLAECLSTLAASYTRLGAFNLALKAQRECYNLDRDSGDPGAISSSLNNLAAICLSLEDYTQATDYIMEAIWYEEPLGNDATLAVRYGMASEVLLKAGRVDEAIDYASRALALDCAGGRDGKAAIRRSQLAAAYMDAGRLDEAKALLEEAVSVFEESGMLNSLSISERQLGRIASLQGNVRLAVKHLSKALDLSRETGNKNHIKGICKDLSDVLYGSDPRAALEYMQLSAQYADSIFTAQTYRQIAELRMESEIAEKDRAISEQQRELKGRMIFIVMLLSVLCLLGVVAFLLARNSAMQKKNNDILLESAELKDKLLSLGVSSSDKNENKEARAILKRLEELGQKPQNILTAREREVADYCCKGLLPKEIAERMNVSQRTVETHKNNIFRKLGINSTVELVMIMHEAEKI